MTYEMHFDLRGGLQVQDLELLHLCERISLEQREALGDARPVVLCRRRAVEVLESLRDR